MAIANSRIKSLKDGMVTFTYKNRKKERTEALTITAVEFIRRFLLHSLPKRFVRIRHYGFLANRNRSANLTASYDEINVLLIKEAPTKMSRAEYIAFYKNMIGPDFFQMSLERMYNAVGQLILKLVGLNKMVVHVGSGNVILLFMNIGLACDFRIVADNTVFQNPNIELGVVPKGASTFFLSKMLGTATASRILLSGRDIQATAAGQLGIVDKVVPLKETAGSLKPSPSVQTSPRSSGITGRGTGGGRGMGGGGRGMGGGRGIGGGEPPR